MAELKIIDCPEALAKLFDYIDGELDSTDRDAFQAHLEFCRPCLSYYEFERYLTEFVKRNAPQPCARNEFKSSLMTRLSEERRALEGTVPASVPARRVSSRMVRFALAASVILALGVAVRWMGHRSAEGVNWALLASYHQGTSQVEEDGLDTTDFAAARAFVVSRMGPAGDSLLPRRLPAGLTCEAACLMPWGNDRLAHLEWRSGGEKISMFVVPVDTLSPAFEPEHRPRIAIQDRDYHLMSRDGLNALCWRTCPKGSSATSAKTHMCVMMSSAGFSEMLAWAESVRRADSAALNDPVSLPAAGSNY